MGLGHAWRPFGHDSSSARRTTELETFTAAKITLVRREGGAKLVSDVELVPRRRKRSLIRWALWGSGTRRGRA
ncbi:MAG: hypothetical protein EOQ40_30045 [Mesorhizobium sp.]|nr:MAG: hypothetical protein EOQ40_30045 [Mesorhizobium sp.]